MMYLRFGWVVGNVGLPIAAVIVLAASGITFITALSASAVATNMRVEVGGAYYIISRSLGLEIGGAIGIPLYLSQTLSVTLYAFPVRDRAFLIYCTSETAADNRFSETYLDILSGFKAL